MPPRDTEEDGQQGGSTSPPRGNRLEVLQSGLDALDAG